MVARRASKNADERHHRCIRQWRLTARWSDL